MDRKRTIVTVTATASVAVVVLVIACWQGWFSSGPPPSPHASQPDLSADPIYKEYQFGQSERVIDVGIQPLWIPTNIIAEAMRRDMVLKDALAREGLEIRFHGFRKGVDVNYFLGRGDLEVGIGGDMPALTAGVESNVLVAAVIQRGACSIVTKRHMLIQDLAGLRIGYALGSVSHYALLHVIESAGLREKDVDLVAMDVECMPDALDRGEIDGFAAWEPTPTIALIQCEHAVVIHQSLSSGYLYFSASFAREHPRALRQIVAAEIRALKWLRSKRSTLRTVSGWAIQSGQTLAERPLLLSQDAYAELARKDLLGMTSFPAITAKELGPSGPLARELKFLKRSGKISRDVQWDDLKKCFDTSVVEEIVREDRKYRLNVFQYAEQSDTANRAN